MKISRRERGALIVLGVGLVALAVDRLILPPPQTASAGEDGAASAGGRSAADLVPQLEVRSFDAPTKPPDEVPDVFATARVRATQNLDELLRAAAEPSAAERFVATFKLHGTVLGPDPVALVGAQTLRVGDTLGGFTLAVVREQEAEFVSDEGRAVLRIGRAGRRP